MCQKSETKNIYLKKKANTFQKGVAFTLKANSFVSRTVSLCLESSWGMFVDKLACPCKLQETAAVCKQPKLVQGTIKVVMTQPQCNHLQEEAFSKLISQQLLSTSSNHLPAGWGIHHDVDKLLSHGKQSHVCKTSASLSNLDELPL